MGVEDGRVMASESPPASVDVRVCSWMGDEGTFEDVRRRFESSLGNGVPPASAAEDGRVVEAEMGMSWRVGG